MFEMLQRNANVPQLNSGKLPVSSQYHTVAVAVSFFFRVLFQVFMQTLCFLI